MTPSTKICSKAEALAEAVIRDHRDSFVFDPDSLFRVDADALPSADIPVATDRRLVDLSDAGLNSQFIHLLQEMYPDYGIINSGCFYYPPSGYMGWHTNSNAPCKRVYIVHSDGKSFFRYKNAAGEIVTEADENGVTIKEFDIPESGEMWHCIYSSGDRVSVGFRLYDSHHV